MTETEVAGILGDAYEMEVRNRNRQMRSGKTYTKLVQMLARWLTAEDMKPGLLLMGGFGNGKTTAAVAIQEAICSVRDAAEQARRDYINSLGYINREPATEYDALYKLPAPMKMTAKEIVDLAQSEDKVRFKAIADSRFLIVDDLGCEPASLKVYGTEVTPVMDVIYRRYDLMLPTVFTTNLDAAGLRSFYGERIADRLKELCETIAFTGASYRS